LVSSEILWDEDQKVDVQEKRLEGSELSELRFVLKDQLFVLLFFLDR